MMTEERKNQLLGNLIFWATEAINNDEEIMNVLHKSVGFTKEELEEFDVEIPEGYFDRTYPYISECVDADYCMKTLSQEGLDYLESVLSDYAHNKISLVVPRDDNDEIDFDGEWDVEVKDNDRAPTETELWILKWYEGYEDIGNVCDEIECEVANIMNEQSGGMKIV